MAEIPDPSVQVRLGNDSVNHRFATSIDDDQTSWSVAFFNNRQIRFSIVAFAFLWLFGISILDWWLPDNIILIGLLVLGPPIASLAMGPLHTALFGVLTLMMTLILGVPDHIFLNERHVMSLILALLIGALSVSISYLRIRLVRALDLAQDRATHDGLTGILNRRAVLEQGNQIALWRTELRPSMSVMMIDVDHFKDIDDTHGHLIGDKVLAGVSKTLSQGFRSGDLFGRYGGDEFLAVLIDSGQSEADQVAERILASMRDSSISNSEGEFQISVSIGMTMVSLEEADLYQAIQRADAALYRSKQAGRARCAWG